MKECNKPLDLRVTSPAGSGRRQTLVEDLRAGQTPSGLVERGPAKPEPHPTQGRPPEVERKAEKAPAE